MRMSQHLAGTHGKTRSLSYDCVGRGSGGPCPARASANTSGSKRDGLLARDADIRAARMEVALAREADALRELGTADEIASEWPLMSIPARRAVIAQVIGCVFVQPGRPPPQRRQTKSCASVPTATGARWAAAGGTTGAHRWTNHERASRAGARRIPCSRLVSGPATNGGRSTFSFRSKTLRYGPRTWTDARIGFELSAYLADKPVWPTVRQFRDDGHERLRRAIMDSGGLKRWAAEVPDVRCPSIEQWTDDSIRNELTALCTDRYQPSWVRLVGRRAGASATVRRAAMCRRLSRRRRRREGRRRDARCLL